jgi:hypothetical protein
MVTKIRWRWAHVALDPDSSQPRAAHYTMQRRGGVAPRDS